MVKTEISDRCPKMAEENDTSKIQKFYAGKSIFITGATGFVGRILLGKLLRSCQQIERIYVLIRSKRGKDGQERLDALMDDIVFDSVKKEFPKYKEKVTAIFGDISAKGFDLSAKDRSTIVNEVSVIFHVAASISFDDTLKKAVDMNVRGIIEIIDIARECKKLEAGVYVSSAYSHCPRKSVGEEFYPPPLTYEECNRVVQSLEVLDLPANSLEVVTKDIIKDWPNTYAFTKAIAEGILAEYGKELPFGLFRPSIVVGAWKEPLPGWAKGFMHVQGVMICVGLGITHTLLGDDNVVLDLVPVDLVCNCLISTAWDIAVHHGTNEDIPVYNYASGSENPIKWTNLVKYSLRSAPKVPLNNAVWHCWFVVTRSKLLYNILDFIFHLIPVLLLDSFRRISGKEPMYYNIYCKSHDLFEKMVPVSSREWEFKNDRVQNLWNRLGSKDKEIFSFSMRVVDWEEYVIYMLNGFRKYILRESDETRPAAQRKQFVFYILHNTILLLGIFIVAWAIWTIFCGIFFRPL